MEKILCTFSYKYLSIVFVTLLVVISSTNVCARDNGDASPLPAKRAGDLSIKSIQVFARPAPVASWQNVKEKSVLYFTNFCTIRVVSTLRIPKGGGVDDLRQTILVEKEGKRRVLVDKQSLINMDKTSDPKTLLIYKGAQKAETILHVEFPCFEDRPDWIKPRTGITLTVIVSSAEKTARKSFSFIYDELSH